MLTAVSVGAQVLAGWIGQDGTSVGLLLLIIAAITSGLVSWTSLLGRPSLDSKKTKKHMC